MGTGKEQKITITASSNLSKEDIDKAVREAEQYAAEDKARKEEVDTRNAGDQMVYQAEKALNELGDKISDSEKAPVTRRHRAPEGDPEGQRCQRHQAGPPRTPRRPSTPSARSSTRPRPQQQPNQGPAAGQSAPNNDGVVDADFEEVNDN